MTSMTDKVDKTFTARCKWFNSKLGYGFLTLVFDVDGKPVEGEELDIFCHHSNIQPKVSTFKTLFPGEYVQCQVVRCAEDSNQEFQASDVTGVGGEQLMVDSREMVFGSGGGRGGRGRGGRGGRGRGGRGSGGD